MCGPTGGMSHAACRSHTARVALNTCTSAHTARIAGGSHTPRAARRSHLRAMHAGHAAIVWHCTQVAHNTVSVLSKRDALKSRMTRTHNGWQANRLGNARMSRTARIAHTTLESHS